jgi:hypothetical protein
MFIAYVKQSGEGCDYTIDCGKTLWRLKAVTKEDAIKELKGLVIGSFDEDYGCYEEGYWDETNMYQDPLLGKVTLFEVSDESEMDLDTWYKTAHYKVEAARSKRDEAKEKAEFERLNSKFS